MIVEPSRVFNLYYILLDIAFLAFFAYVLFYTKRYLAIFVGIIGGIIYFIVDYGIFYLMLGTRTVEGANTFWLLLWLSMSYGFTNFTWIWLWLDKDKHTLEWSLLVVGGWFATALLGQWLGANAPDISISRGTGGYHGIMGLILFVGYAILCLHNINCKIKEERYNIPRILAIGLLVQFAWEFILLVTGIRAQGIGPIIVNSLLETNLGLPYIFLIHRAVSSRYQENLKPAEHFVQAEEAIS